jgi:hypothetical protein
MFFVFLKLFSFLAYNYIFIKKKTNLYSGRSFAFTELLIPGFYFRKLELSFRE